MARPSLSRSIATVAVVAMTLAATACGGGDDLARPSEEFCELAYEYDQQVAIIGPDDPEGHLEHLEPMAELAPDDVREDLDTVVDALRRLVDGDSSGVDDPEVEAANNRVNRRSIDGCRLHDQEPAGGI